MTITTWLEEVRSSSSIQELEECRVRLLGKNGLLTQQLKSLSSLSLEEKKIQGAKLNEIKDTLQKAFDEKKQELENQALEDKLKKETLDLSLPTRHQSTGRIHPISYVMREIAEYFSQRGFGIVGGPEIETEEFNFSALNIPDHHPARQSHDTFYVDMPDHEQEGRYLLRTHTSNNQIHVLKNKKPPVRMIAMGRCYRADLDATHSPMFHQIEGFVIDENIHMGHLKATIQEFCEAFFNIKDLPFLFRPSFFPFTEPSAEVDIGCVRKPGEPLKLSHEGGWLEILGCGMIHPKVLENCGIDSTVYSGFAFGGGIERLLMLKYGISDIRLLYEGDRRWLNHYGFYPFES